MLFAGLHRSNLIGGWRGGDGPRVKQWSYINADNSFKRRALGKDICKAGLSKKEIL